MRRRSSRAKEDSHRRAEKRISAWPLGRHFCPLQLDENNAFSGKTVPAHHVAPMGMLKKAMLLVIGRLYTGTQTFHYFFWSTSHIRCRYARHVYIGHDCSWLFLHIPSVLYIKYLFIFLYTRTSPVSTIGMFTREGKDDKSWCRLLWYWK